MSTTLTVIAAVAAGLAGGIFLAFSTFVMAGLDRPGPTVGVAAMQGINATAPAPPFMALLFGGPLVGIAAAATSGDGWVIVGAVAFLVPALMTMAFHVPRNLALDRVTVGSDEAAAAWTTYLREWTGGNHVRTLGATVAAVAFTLALVA